MNLGDLGQQAAAAQTQAAQAVQRAQSTIQQTAQQAFQQAVHWPVQLLLITLPLINLTLMRLFMPMYRPGCFQKSLMMRPQCFFCMWGITSFAK